MMKIHRSNRVFVVTMLLGLLATGVTVPVHAAPRSATATHDAPTPATLEGIGSNRTGGMSDPVILVPSQAQLEDHARRLDEGKAWAQQYRLTHPVPDARPIRPAGDPGGFGGTQGCSNVTAYKEPNTPAYRNYCGPGASQVVVSNWTSNVPSIDTVATQEHTDPTGLTHCGGTCMVDMPGPINSDAGTNFYINASGSSQGAFSNEIGTDIRNNGHPLITAIKTHIVNGPTLTGWTVTAGHIISIYCYNFVTPGAGTVTYVETAGSVAGTSGTGRNTYNVRAQRVDAGRKDAREVAQSLL